MSALAFVLQSVLRIRSSRRLLAIVICTGMASIAANAAELAPLAPNETAGFGNGKVLTFTYLQSFDCVVEPKMDLNFNGVPAQSDPNELQTPICQVVTEPTLDPSGGVLERTAQVYVLIPMFGASTNPADAMACPSGGRTGELCGEALGAALIALFGHIPEAWMTKPTVATQCPDPNNAVPGTCTMHASSVDLAVLLEGTPGIPSPPTGSIFLPTPNHDHVVDDDEVTTKPIWWQVRPVLIMNASDWPAADGSSGITSSQAMDAAEAAGNAVEVGSNFFLFFSSKMSSMGM